MSKIYESKLKKAFFDLNQKLKRERQNRTYTGPMIDVDGSTIYCFDGKIVSKEEYDLKIKGAR